MEWHSCDICDSVLKNIVYVIAFNRVDKRKLKPQDSQPMTLEELFRSFGYGKRDKVTVKEVCPKCHKVLEYLIRLRVKEVIKLQKDVDRLFETPHREEE